MDWVEYFRHNRANRMPVPWERGIQVEPHLGGLLIRSLQRFQLGESGDGSHLKGVAKSAGDADYIAAVELFVEEEQEHAALMASVIEALGGNVLKQHWTDRCFRAVCLISGLHIELMVLLVAELIAKRYFRLLYEATHDPVLRSVCKQIGHDEEAHIIFHSATLQREVRGWYPEVRHAARVTWRIFFQVVCGVVLYDHKRLIRAAGTSPQKFRRDCLRLFDKAAGYVFGTEGNYPAGVITRATQGEAQL